MATVKTTIKTETCAYTEYKIYPGHGTKCITKDGKSHILINSKADSLFHQKIKPVRLTWTQVWRRMNKKVRHMDGTGKRRVRKVVRTQKPIIGLTLEDIKKKTAAAKSVPSARVAALNESRARHKEQSEKAKHGKGLPKIPKQMTQIPKNQPKVNKQQGARR